MNKEIVYFDPVRFRTWIKRMEKISIIDLLTGKYKTPKEYILY